jgi:hypothetical protein
VGSALLFVAAPPAAFLFLLAGRPFEFSTITGAPSVAGPSGDVDIGERVGEASQLEAGETNTVSFLENVRPCTAK